MRLIDCFTDLFVFVRLAMSGKRRYDGKYEVFRAKIVELIDQAKTRADIANIPTDRFQAAFFAVIAWVDESVLCSKWAGAANWKAKQLQIELLGTNRAGEEFYKKLGDIPQDWNGVREVYYYCLLLGFRGRYFRQTDSTAFNHVKSENLGQLLRGSDNADLLNEYLSLRNAKSMKVATEIMPETFIGEFKKDLHLFPQVYASAVKNENPNAMSILSWVVIVIAPVIILASVYTVLRLDLGAIVPQFINTVKF